MPAILGVVAPYIATSTITLSDIVFASVVTHFACKAADFIFTSDSNKSKK